jgi:hypothetical protein
VYQRSIRGNVSLSSIAYFGSDTDALVSDFPSGFPRLAAFQAADPSYSLYRGFAYLHSRLLLDLQDELAQLEKELEEVDWDDADEHPDRLRSREIDVIQAAGEGNLRNRRRILEEIKTKLTEYGL